MPLEIPSPAKLKLINSHLSEQEQKTAKKLPEEVTLQLIRNHLTRIQVARRALVKLRKSEYELIYKRVDSGVLYDIARSDIWELLYSEDPKERVNTIQEFRHRLKDINLSELKMRLIRHLIDAGGFEYKKTTHLFAKVKTLGSLRKVLLRTLQGTEIEDWERNTYRCQKVIETWEIEQENFAESCWNAKLKYEERSKEERESLWSDPLLEPYRQNLPPQELHTYTKLIYPRLYNEKMIRELRKPLVILITGTSGTGKSTVAEGLTRSLGIPRIYSTDSFREALRDIYSEKEVPFIYISSYEGPKGRELEHFYSQALFTSKAILSVLNRIQRENTSVIIEGVHLIPGLIPGEFFDRLNIVQIIIVIEDEKVHRSRFEKRGIRALSRKAEKYINHLATIYLLNRHFKKVGRENPDLGKKEVVNNIGDPEVIIANLAKEVKRPYINKGVPYLDPTRIKVEKELTKWNRNSLLETVKRTEADHTLKPLVLVDKGGNREGRIKEDDSVIFCFTRSEREVEITEVFIKKGLKIKLIAMTDYDEKFRDKVEVAFPAIKVRNTVSEVVSRYGLKQVKITESEKEVHLGKFYNGMREKPFPKEKRIIIPSPRVDSFDQKPEMNIEAVTKAALREIQNKTNKYILINFPNLDVVGHCGRDNASIRAIESVDSHLGIVIEKAKNSGMIIIVAADHGSVEYSQTLHHTTNPVPFILISNSQPELREGGELADIAPTQLEILELENPEEMSGKSLIKNSSVQGDRLLTVILDGWGIREEIEDNLIARANTPIMDGLKKDYSYTTLRASGEAVGLSPKRPGNSEAGHLTIGAGRRIPSLDLRIKQAIKDGSFWKNRTLLSAIKNAKNQNSALHILGMLSEESSHGTIEHIMAILELAKQKGLKKVYLHGVLDRPGETPAIELIKKAETKIADMSGKEFILVTLVGRDIALDRSKRYERIEMTYNALVSNE